MVYSPCFGKRDLVFHFMFRFIFDFVSDIIKVPPPIRQTPAHERRFLYLCMLPPDPIIAHEALPDQEALPDTRLCPITSFV